MLVTFVAYNFNKVDFERLHEIDRSGNSRNTENTGHSLAGIWPAVQESVAKKMNIPLIEVQKSAIAIGHLTGQAIGSNSYRKYNRIVLLHAPYKPMHVTRNNQGVQGKDLTPYTDMVSSLIQATGRGCIRTGSMTTCTPMTVESSDIPESVMMDVKKYFDSVTWDISSVPTDVLNIAVNSKDRNCLNSVYQGYGGSDSAFDLCSHHTRTVCQAIINYRFGLPANKLTSTSN